MSVEARSPRLGYDFPRTQEATMSTTGDLAAIFAALYAAHQVADHWVQTPGQASRKGLPGATGRLACTAHVLTYTATAVGALLLLAAGTGWRPAPVALAIGLLLSAASHYVADRREPLRRLAYLAGKDRGWVEEGGGLYLLDQSWHIGFLFLSALIINA